MLQLFARALLMCSLIKALKSLYKWTPLYSCLMFWILYDYPHLTIPILPETFHPPIIPLTTFLSMFSPTFLPEHLHQILETWINTWNNFTWNNFNFNIFFRSAKTCWKIIEGIFLQCQGRKYFLKILLFAHYLIHSLSLSLAHSLSRIFITTIA